MPRVEAIKSVHTGCLNCGIRPDIAPIDWQPHPGFGSLCLIKDGKIPRWWEEFASYQTKPHTWGSWETGEIKVGPRKGQKWHDWIGGEEYWSLDQYVSMKDIEEAVTEDPDHDYRLEIRGPLGGVIYQRHGDKKWCPIERLDGFA